MRPEGIREDWFPTSIWYFDQPDLEEYHAEWVRELYRLREEDRVGITDRSTRLGWHSDVDLHKNPRFQILMDRILEVSDEVAEFGQWALSAYDVSMINAWGIINPRNGYNSMHNHPSSYLSGVYYLEAPENSGDIVFRDPREVRMMEVIPLASNNRWTFKTVKYNPLPGRMIIFPSWLLHEVMPNLTDDDRICVSFNVGCKLKPST